MFALLLFCLVPVPRDAPPFPVGEFAADWGQITQQMIFHPDGSYSSREFGNGYWSTDREGYIWFSERKDTAFYMMWLDSKTGSGTGWRHDRDTGGYGGEVKVKLKPKGR